METEEQSAFESFDKKIIRRKLLPIWIKIFCWLFMIMSICSLGVVIMGVFNKNADLSMYGFETDKPFSLIGIFLIIIILYKGFVAYNLWFEKDNAIDFAKYDAVIGIVICLISMFIMPFVEDGFKVTIRIEIALLVLFYRKITQIEYEWDNLEEE